MLDDNNDPRHIRRNAIAQLAGAGIEEGVIAWHVGCSLRTIIRWENRVMCGETLADKQRSGRPMLFDDAIVARVIAWYTQSKPLDTCGQWSLRWGESYLRHHQEVLLMPISKSSIHRIIQDHYLRPHLLKYFLHITDPDFFPKMEHIISVYQRGLRFLFCFDECPGIQVLQRNVPRSRSSTRAITLDESHYSRHGTIDVMAFLQVSTGCVVSHATSNHTGETFRKAFQAHVMAQPPGEQLHYIMDNLSTHCGHDFCRLVARLSKVTYSELPTVEQRCSWLGGQDKRIVVHFTPYHGSWLNMAEIWFSILRDKCLNHPFAAPQLMIDAIQRFTNAEWNAYLAHEFKWRYSGEGLHQKVVFRVTDLLRNHHTELNIAFLTKQMLLIINMARDYWEHVSNEAWEGLLNVIRLREPYIAEMVSKESSLKRRMKALAALNQLQASLTNWPVEHFAEAA